MLCVCVYVRVHFLFSFRMASADDLWFQLMIQFVFYFWIWHELKQICAEGLLILVGIPSQQFAKFNRIPNLFIIIIIALYAMCPFTLMPCACLTSSGVNSILK